MNQISDPSFGAFLTWLLICSILLVLFSSTARPLPPYIIRSDSEADRALRKQGVLNRQHNVRNDRWERFAKYETRHMSISAWWPVR
jgi:hypothetical protein